VKNRTPLKDRLLLTIPQVQQLTGVSRATVTRRVASGDYRTMQEGKRVRIVTASILETIDRETKATREAVGLAS
jgi:predicted DNA-binding transcriptional regulator AlpA